MKWLIASDIHGSKYYLEKLLKAFIDEKADKLLLLGDLLYHGPRNDLPKDYNPKACIELLNQNKDKILCVQGNCDADVDQMVLDFPIMTKYAIIANENHIIYITHGHELNESNPPKLSKGDILLHGHTHIPACIEHKNYTYMNPGSISIPKANSYHGYMTYDEKVFIWKDFEGTIHNKK